MARWSVSQIMTLCGWIALSILLDVYVYGLILPAVGTFMASTASTFFALPPLTEILLTIATVFGLMYVTFTLNLEVKYWKHLFQQDKGYITILRFRDAVAAIVLINNLGGLYQSIEAIAGDASMKQKNLGEGIGFVFWNNFASHGAPVPHFFMTKYAIPTTAPAEAANRSWLSIFSKFSDNWNSASSAEPNRGNTASFMIMIHATSLLFWMASITASVTKMLYFNTLHTYLRSMDIFMDMQDALDDRRREAAGPSSTGSTITDYVSDYSVSYMSQTQDQQQSLAAIRSQERENPSTHQHLQLNPSEFERLGKLRI